MNIGGVLMLSFIGSLPQSAAAQAAFAVSYIAALLADHVDVRRPDGRRGGGGRPEPRRATCRIARTRRCTSRPDTCLAGAARLGLLFFFLRDSCSRCLRHARSRTVVTLGVHLLRVLSVSGLFIAVALTYTGGSAGHGRHEEPTLHLDHVADRSCRSGSASSCSGELGRHAADRHIWSPS